MLTFLLSSKNYIKTSFSVLKELIKGIMQKKYLIVKKIFISSFNLLSIVLSSLRKDMDRLVSSLN